MGTFVLESEKYKIIRELGRGGMGVVYLAEDLLLKRTVALKVLYDHLNRDASFVNRFQEEARSVSSLHHPNVVFVHGLELVKDTFLIDMEYVEGHSLDKIARSKTIAPPVAVRIAVDILEGLAACHSVGVIHRDIKPANVLLTQNGTAKITDFGLATAYAGHLMDSVKGHSASGFFMGTPRYAPPAAWDGLKPLPGWDLYSLGVILFELLSGQVAYPGETPMAIMRQHLMSPLPSLSTVAPTASRELCECVDSLVANDGMNGSASAADVLRTIQGTPEYEKMQEGDSARTVRVARRREWLVRRGRPLQRPLVRGLFAVLFLAVAATLWVTATRPSGPARPKPTATSSILDNTVVFLRPEPVEGPATEEATWMFSQATKGGPASIVVLADMGLWKLALKPGAEKGRYTVRGEWGEYLRPAIGSIRYGTFHGAALLDPSDNKFSFTLTKLNTRDNARTSLHLQAKPIDIPMDQSQFVLALESNQSVQCLLYNELLPRKLPWARDIEALMPSFPAGRLTVFPLETAIVVDGALDEFAWRRPRENTEIDDGTAVPGIRALWSPEAVYLGLDTDHVTLGTRLEIVLEPGLESANIQSGRFVVGIDRDGEITGNYQAGAGELPWNCDWEAATAVWDDGWQVEIRIPLANFSPTLKPEAGRRWRINASLQDTENGRPVTYWGYDELGAVEHGVIMTFSEDLS